MLGRGAADATVRAGGLEPIAQRPFVEHLANLGTAGDEITARSIDVGDDQVQVLGGAGRGRREAGAELDRAVGARRGELDEANVVTIDVGVESPAEACFL